ncbi:MAG: DUF4956 domain-containing protein [Eubacteriales bacterium]|nr:DUF4956 domain-containing protein [Eubacteriales bacterium]
MKEAILDLLDTDINQPLSLERILTTFAVTLLMGIVIWLVYRITYRGTLYNRSFGTALLMVSLVTALIIMPISSNIVLSLGMVGALSIVRFRTALKDPLDIVYMFWAIALGLTAGAGFFQLAILGGLILAAIMLLTAALQTGIRRSGWLLILRYDHHFQGDLKRLLPRHQVKSKSSTAQGIELIVEINLRRDDGQLVERLQRQPGVISASLVRSSGDYQ